MFATRIKFSQATTSRALGALFALTAALTSLLAPAYAATPAAAGQSLDLAPAATTIQTRDRMESLASPMFQPDIRVKYIGPAYNNGKYLYRFRVENIGAASADNIFVDEEVHQLSYDGSVGVNQAVGGQNIASLAADGSVEIKVTCIPLPGYVCAGASATAMLDGDLDASNNHAHS